jgi:CcmD family protein
MKRLKIAATVACLIALSASVAFAEGYEKVPDRDPTTIAANPFLAGAYGFIWVALLVYVVVVARGLNKATNEVKELRRKLEQQS